jgi:hypothetical protein
MGGGVSSSGLGHRHQPLDNLLEKAKARNDSLTDSTGSYPSEQEMKEYQDWVLQNTKVSQPSDQVNGNNAMWEDKCPAPSLPPRIARYRSQGGKMIEVAQNVVGPAPLPDGSPGIALKVVRMMELACLSSGVVQTYEDVVSWLEREFGKADKDKSVDLDYLVCGQIRDST